MGHHKFLVQWVTIKAKELIRDERKLNESKTGLTMSSKLERLVFSGREDDFLYFAEQFEARMHSLKLGKVLSGEATYLDYVPAVRNNSSEEQRRQAIEKGREELEEKKKTLWYELVHALDKTSVLFLRPHKGDGTRAWDVLCKRFKNFERPQRHKLIAQLTSLRKTSSKSIVDYLNRADDMQYNLTLVNEGISEKVFVSIILKGLPKEYENLRPDMNMRPDKLR